MLIALFSLAALGQVNNENVAAAVQEDGLGVTLGAGGATTGGNLAMFDIRGQLGLQFRRSVDGEGDQPPWLRDLAVLNASGSYLSVGGRPFFDNRLVSLGYIRMASRRVGVNAGLQYQNNLLLLLDGRWTAAVGARFVIVRSTRFDLGGGLGAMVEHEVRNVDLDGPDPRLMTNPRAVSRVSWRLQLVPQALQWRHTLYAQPRIDRWADHLIVDYHTVEARVTDVLSVTSDLQIRYDSQPPVGVKRVDTRLTWGVKLQWAARPGEEHPHH